MREMTSKAKKLSNLAQIWPSNPLKYILTHQKGIVDVEILLKCPHELLTENLSNNYFLDA